MIPSALFPTSTFAQIPLNEWGTQARPYILRTPADLDKIKTRTNKRYYYRLGNNINYGGTWSPIHPNATDNYVAEIDGAGYTISGLSGSGTVMGFFRYASGNVSIKNLNLSVGFSVPSGSASGNTYLGGMIGRVMTGADVSITNCAISGSLSTGNEINYAGGFVGRATGATTNLLIIKSTYGGTMSITSGTGAYGGMVGNIAANVKGSLTQCRVYTNIMGSSTNDSYVGGIVGSNNSTVFSVSECHFIGNVRARLNVGGIVGYTSGKVLNCYARGDVKNTMNAQIGTPSAGGCVGYAAAAITTCYAAGTITKVISYSGGCVGYVGSGGSGSNNYYDSTLNGHGDTKGGSKAMTTAALKAALPSGFSGTIWTLDAAINDGYPHLINNPPR